MSTVTEKHWTPTRTQKMIAAVDGFFGKAFNNQARILESRTTRSGVPYGPGGTVTPPASFFKSQPPDIGQSTFSKDSISAASSRTAVGGDRAAGSGGKGSKSGETGMSEGRNGGINGKQYRARARIGGK